MVGEIEEPVRHEFEAAGSYLSGSISFGRFESEILCWERRSSFSHNRYLEEVEKCSKPGSVTEKKAYFEAHFRKKKIMPQSSPESTNEIENYRTSENEKMGCDEDIDDIDTVHGTSNSETQFELTGDGEAKESFDVEESNLDMSRVSDVTIGPLGDDRETEGNSDASAKSQRGSSSKEKIPSQIEHTKLESAPQVSVAPSRRYISEKSSKGSEEKPSKPEKNVVMRKKAENKTSEASAREKRPIHEIPKNEPVSKAKGIGDIKRSEKISRNRRIEEPQTSTLKFSTKVNQRMNRIKSAVGMPQPCVKQDTSRSSFKCNERTEKRNVLSEEKKHAKEANTHQLQAQTQEKTDAAIKQLRKSLNFKATPLPSFYRGAQRDPDRTKATDINPKPRNIHTNSSSIGTRVSERPRLSSTASKDKAVFSSQHPKTTDVPHASEATSCHSTVTSDSSPSSPSAVTSDSQAVINSQAGRKKENEIEKRTSLHKQKGPKVKKTDTGKRMDGKEKKRTERTIYAAFTSSSRTGH